MRPERTRTALEHFLVTAEFFARESRVKDAAPDPRERENIKRRGAGMTSFYFVEPTDTLFVRGNLAFGDAGEHGPGVMPPPPSLFAGAFRSAILGRDADALARFSGQGATGIPHGAPWHARPRHRAGHRVRVLSHCLAHSSRSDCGQGRPSLEPVFTLPADLIKQESGFAHLTPEAPHPLVADGRTLTLYRMLRTAKQAKPETGFYLREAGWCSHIAGELPDQPAAASRPPTCTPVTRGWVSG